MKHCFYTFLTAVLLVSCVQEAAIDKTSQEAVQENAADAGVVSGKINVCFSDEMVAMIESDLADGGVMTRSAGLNLAADNLRITEMRRVFSHGGAWEPLMRKEGLHKWYTISYSNEIPVTKAESILGVLEGIEKMEPVVMIERKSFNDPDFSKLWGLYNEEYPEYDINVTRVWEDFTTGDPKVIVAVMDEGVDINHPDLKANCLSSTYSPSKFVPGDHGTHVAGTIAAVSDNGIGISGIAGGKKGHPGVKIYSCQILGADRNENTFENAMTDAVSKGAVISQNSWGYSYKDENGNLIPSTPKEASETHKKAIDYFIKYAGCTEDGTQQREGSPMKGGVVIFAAGNDNIEYGAPANYKPTEVADAVIAVGSIDKDGFKSDFSSYGNWVDIAAPGRDIYSTYAGEKYGYENGTSMACPHVSGVAALLVSYFGGDGFTNEQLVEKILKGAKPLEKSKIGPLLDAYGAFTYGEDVTVSPVTEFTAAARNNQIDLSWKVPADSDGKPAYGYLIFYGKDGDNVAASVRGDLKEGVKTMVYNPESSSVGAKEEYTLDKLEFETAYHVKVVAYSYSSAYSDASEVKTVETSGNLAPEIVMDYDGITELKSYQNITVPFKITEPDGHEFSVTYVAGAKAAESFSKTKDGVWELKIIAKNAKPGTYTVKVVAEDEFKRGDSKSEAVFTYTILPNRAPEKLGEMENVMLTAKDETFEILMSDYVKDADDDPLSYEIEVSNNLVLHIRKDGDRLIGMALGYGAASVVIRAVDAKDEKAVFKFDVQVRNPESGPVTVYPTAVKDFVTVGTLEAAETHIKVVGQTGKKVYESNTIVSGYKPAKLDLSSCSPGVYVVIVEFGGKQYKQNIVKL